MIEILLVIVMISILIGVGAPAVQRSVDRAQVRQAAEEVTNLLRYARTNAVNEHKVIKILLAARDMRLAWINKDGEENTLAGVMGRRRHMPSRVRIENAPPALVFYPSGKIDPVEFRVSDGRTVFLISTKEIMGHVVMEEAAPGS